MPIINTRSLRCLLALAASSGGAFTPARAADSALWPSLSAPARVGGGEGDAALVAAIERYAFVSPVTGAAQNAVDWFNHLVRGRGLPLDAVRLLKDSAVTKEKLLRYARRAAAAVKPGGTLWVVFIGHGAPGRDGKDAVLVGVDAQQDADSLYERSVLRSELLGIAASSKAARVVVVLDTCFSGRTSQDGKPIVAGLQPLVVSGPASGLDPRVLLFTAAKGNEFAGPLPGAARPSFSYLLLGGLRGWADAKDAGGDGDGKVSAKELHAYTKRALSSLLTDRTQTPTFDGEGSVALGAASERGPDLAKLIARSSATAASATGPATSGATTSLRAAATQTSGWSATPQIGPTTFRVESTSRTLFGISADISRRTSERFSFGLFFSAGFGSNLLLADAGPQFVWRFPLGQQGDHVPYFRFGIPLRYFNVTGQEPNGFGALDLSFLAVGIPMLGFGYHYFITKSIGVGINFTFVPAIIFADKQTLNGEPLSSTFDNFIFSFQLGFGVQAHF